MKPTSIIILALIIFSSCKKNSDQPAVNAGLKSSLTLQFDNIAGAANVQLNTGRYTNSVGEDFTITMLQYYISNVQLTTTDGTKYAVPQDSSYFLVRESDPATQFCKLNVPLGEYRSVSFVLGVDSLRSTMDVSKRTGVLDPAATGHDDGGMYWGWNSGYIFFRMEGISSFAPADPAGLKKFRYHIGGFGGYSAPSLNNIKNITLDLSANGTAKVREGRSSNVHIMVDVLKMFNGATDVSIAANPTVMFGDYSARVAANYVQMFRHDHTEN
ncbi:MbnP family protein [Sediminibacterium ginsengisoli]|uniref:Copper-binding protein MbnP-like domain-containing protein n=1 Tax=Sediminibacterium ginsengisoli TaxID=413434 RepID=A0A1T4K0A7_9BACT|nr:MbnP family protein [Sediminibacterium ginsengisoli]SJZ35942.1 hypothetical protein SAMN04488132_101362 [Sediminibacterium ginsengisoli]